MEKEIWKDVKNFEGYYQVSDLGRVKRLAGSPKCKTDRILKYAVRTNYGYVDLCENSKTTSYPVHRLVLETFVGPQPEGKDPDHRNEIKLDNKLSNLRWLNIYKNRAKLGESNGSSKLKEGEVWLMRRLLSHGVKVNGYMEKMFKVHPCTIKRIKRGDRWKHIKYEV